MPPVPPAHPQPPHTPPGPAPTPAATPQPVTPATLIAEGWSLLGLTGSGSTLWVRSGVQGILTHAGVWITY